MTLKIPIHHKSKGTHDMLIDEEDYDKIKNLNIRLNCASNKHTFYAQHTVYENCKYVGKIHIHRLIMALGDYKEDKRIINHIDGNGLNNQKSNLEICDNMYNSQSFRQPHRKCKSYYFENDPKRKCKWRVTLKINGKSKSKRFMTEEECIKYINELVTLELI
jgi:hypothetical protein